MTPPADKPRSTALETSRALAAPPGGQIEITAHAERAIRPQDAVELFREEGWWPHRTASITAALLENSSAVGAWQGDQLIGFARAVSDGVERAYVEDVVVASSMRRTGVGAQLVEALMKHLAHIPSVSLFCTADIAVFYERSGFHRTRQVMMHRDAGTLER